MSTTKLDLRIIIFDNDGNSNVINSNNIIEFHFTENIYSMGIIGKLSFKDMDKIVKVNTIKRNEIIVAEINQNDTSRELWFKAIDVKSQTISSSETVCQEITFYLVNLEYETMKDIKIPSYGTNIKLSDLIKNIANESNISKFNAGFGIEESNESYESFSLFDTSFSLIKYLLPRMSGQSGTSGFVFYPCNIPDDDRSFSWYLTTLTSLLKNTNLMICDSSWDDGMYFYSSGDYPIGHLNQMMWCKKISNYNKLSKNLKGFLTSEFISNGKKPVFIVDTVVDMYKKFTGNSTDSQDYQIAKISYHGENDTTMMKNISFDNFIKSLCIINLHTFEVSGHINRYAGGMINVALPPGQYAEEETQVGLHLIKSISHIFKINSTIPYRQILTTIRNTFFDKNLG